MELRMDSLEETVNDEQQIRTQMADTIKREKELSASVSKMRSVRNRVNSVWKRTWLPQPRPGPGELPPCQWRHALTRRSSLPMSWSPTALSPARGPPPPSAAARVCACGYVWQRACGCVCRHPHRWVRISTSFTH